MPSGASTGPARNLDGPDRRSDRGHFHFTKPSGTADTSRTDLTVRLSRDDGASRPDHALLKPGASGYSTMAVLAEEPGPGDP